MKIETNFVLCITAVVVDGNICELLCADNSSSGRLAFDGSPIAYAKAAFETLFLRLCCGNCVDMCAGVCWCYRNFVCISHSLISFLYFRMLIFVFPIHETDISIPGFHMEWI